MPKLIFQTPLDVPQARSDQGPDARGRRTHDDDFRKSVGRGLTALASLPFATGNLFENVALPGIRGQVLSVSGPELTLRVADTVDNFAAYPGTGVPPGPSIVFACPPEMPTSRAGSVQLAEVARRVVATPNGHAFKGVLVSGEGDWDAEIPGIAAGDYLYTPVEGSYSGFGVVSRLAFGDGTATGDFYGPTVRLATSFRDRHHVPSGVMVLRSEIQAAQVCVLGDRGIRTRDYIAQRKQGRHYIDITSRYACRADLWVF